MKAHKWEYEQADIYERTGWVNSQAYRYCKRCGHKQLGGPEGDYSIYDETGLEADCDEELIRRVMES